MYWLAKRLPAGTLPFLTLIAIIAGLAGYAWAQGAIKITSFATPFQFLTAGPGPQSTFLQASGGTFVCTAGGTITVANANVDAGSVIIMTLKTVGGTVANPFVATITAGTGFTATCGGSDTSTYNYAVLG